ncbi:MAG: hypothetical protein E3J64_09515, partial [Anaerolineales bacterium]
MDASSSAGRRRRQEPRRTIGLLIDRLYEHGGYHPILWRGIMHAAQEQDVNLIVFAGGPLASADHPEFRRNAIFDLISTDNVDGLVISGGTLSYLTSHDELELFCNRFRHLPTVNIALRLGSAPSVLIDNEGGVREAMAHLIGLHGFKRIAFIRGPEANQEAEQRYRSYAAILEEHSIPLDPNLVAPGDFLTASGAAAVGLLLDERGVEFDAIVAANDNSALGAMGALLSRGIDVPGDIAVVGFDDTAEGRSAVPPLTTVRQPAYELGRRAVETLLTALEGNEVPEQVVLPTELIVRQSCGCTPARALPPPARKKARRARSALSRAQRNRVASQALEAFGEAERQTDNVADRVAQLLDAFTDDVEKGNTTSAFLQLMDETLRRSMESRDSTAPWERVLAVCSEQTLNHYTDPDALSRATRLCLQAWALVGEVSDLSLSRHRVQTEDREETVRHVSQALIGTFDVSALIETMAEELPRAGIRRCWVSLYEEEQQVPAEWSRLMLAYDDGNASQSEGHSGRERIVLGEEGHLFPSSQLVPEGLLPEGERYDLSVISLYFRDKAFGFAVFGVDEADPTMHELLSTQISTALQGAQLVRQAQQEIAERERAEDDLRQRNADLDAFAETVAHDLRAPLGLQVLASSVLESDIWNLPRETVEARLRGITQSGLKMVAIIEALLLLASVGKEEVRGAVPLDMAAIVAEAQSRLR